MAINAWLLKGKIREYDKHLTECNHRAVNTGQMEQRLETVEQETKYTRRTLHWVGDCLMTIGTKMGVNLPERPN